MATESNLPSQEADKLVKLYLLKIYGVSISSSLLATPTLTGGASPNPVLHPFLSPYYRLTAFLRFSLPFPSFFTSFFPSFFPSLLPFGVAPFVVSPLVHSFVVGWFFP
eukprot:GHVT01019007.1.p1 GENE.GHVT01019007.1~~GHVT01019007.1.p1  ORF type:complete len:108 (+),score=16.95 GHVT01019007.1:450-773(+)